MTLDFKFGGQHQSLAVIPWRNLKYTLNLLIISGGNTWSQQYGQYDIPDVQIYNMNTGEWKKGRVSIFIRNNVK